MIRFRPGAMFFRPIFRWLPGAIRRHPKNDSDRERVDSQIRIFMSESPISPQKARFCGQIDYFVLETNQTCSSKRVWLLALIMRTGEVQDLFLIDFDLFNFVQKLDANICSGAPTHFAAAVNAVTRDIDLHTIEQAIAIFKAQARAIC